MNRSRAPYSTVTSPRRGCSPTRAEVRRQVQAEQVATRAAAFASMPRVQLVERQAPLPLDGGQAGGVGRDPPERDRLVTPGVHDPLQLAVPEREHLGDVGEDLGRSPASPRAHRRTAPRAARARRHGRRVAGPRAGARPASIRAGARSSPWRQCGTTGVAWVATSPGRRGRSAAVRRLAARERRDDRDHLARRRQPGRRPDRRGRLREGGRLPAARRHRPRRVLGRQRPPGGRLLPRAVGLHAGRLQRPRDEGPRPGQLRHGPERHPVRLHRAADAGRRDRRARPRARRRRPRHRLRGRRRRGGLARDDLARRASARSTPTRARRRRGRRPSPGVHPHVRRGRSTRSSTGATTTAPSRRATARSSAAGRGRDGLSLLEVDHCVGNVGARRDGPLRRLLPRRPRLRPAHPLRRQGHPHRLSAR